MIIYNRAFGLGFLSLFTRLQLLVFAPAQAASTCTINAFATIDGKQYGTGLPADAKVGDKLAFQANFNNCDKIDKGANGKGEVFLNIDGKVTVPISAVINKAYQVVKVSINLASAGTAKVQVKVVNDARDKALYDNPTSLSFKIVPGSGDGNSDGNTEGNTEGNTDQGDTGDTLDVGETVQSPIGINSIGELIVRLIKYLLALVASVAVLSIVIGGFRMVMSAGNETGVAAGKKAVLWAVLGLITSVMAFTIVSILQDVLEKK